VDRELRARALGVRLSAFLAGYAAAVGHHALLAEALAGLRRVAEQPARVTAARPDTSR
jgi:hypothetical protein